MIDRVQAEIWERVAGLPKIAVTVFRHMLSVADDGGRIVRKRIAVAMALGLSERQVARAYRALEVAGVVRRVTKGRRFNPSCFQIQNIGGQMLSPNDGGNMRNLACESGPAVNIAGGNGAGSDDAAPVGGTSLADSSALL